MDGLNMIIGLDREAVATPLYSCQLFLLLLFFLRTVKQQLKTTRSKDGNRSTNSFSPSTADCLLPLPYRRCFACFSVLLPFLFAPPSPHTSSNPLV